MTAESYICLFLLGAFWSDVFNGFGWRGFDRLLLTCLATAATTLMANVLVMIAK